MMIVMVMNDNVTDCNKDLGDNNDNENIMFVTI